MQVTDPRQALEFLGVKAGTPLMVTLLGSGLIASALNDGSLRKKLMTKKVTHERHLFRYAFPIWDRIRTGEMNPWQCTLCAKRFSGLAALSAFALLDHVRDAPLPNKPGIMALICGACDSESTEQTKRQVFEAFGLMPPVAEGHA